MKPFLSVLPLLAAFLAPALCSQAHAEQIFKGKNLNEKSLVEALAPEPVVAPASPQGDKPLTRSITVVRDQPSSQVVSQMARAPAKEAKAGVLITFVTGSAHLAESAKSSLDVVAKALQSERLTNFRFAIEGHADPRGTPEHNLELSQARAETVVDYLSETHRISRDRLKPVGKGDTEQLNRRQPDAPENRRVTIATLRE
jgi:OOP family OmpA-OmpF porin